MNKSHFSSRKKQLKQAALDENSSVLQRKYILEYLKKEKYIRFYRILILVLFLLLWELLAEAHIIDPFIFSSPSRVFFCFLTMAEGGEIFFHIGVTLLETLVSFFLAISLGLIIAIFLWWNEGAAKIFEPYLVVLNSLPKSALAPVFIVWLGNNAKTIIVAAISIVIFGTIISLYTDFLEVEEDKIKLIQTLGGTKRDILTKVVLPSNIPSMISIMKVNIGLSLVGVIIGEFLAANAGLGYLIIYGSQVFKLDWVIMSIVILCFIAMGLYHLIAIIEKKYLERI